MANAPVAGRYAQALFELGIDSDQVQDLGEALANLSRLFEDGDELRSVLLNPAIKLSERRDVIAAIAKKARWPQLFCNFVMLLLDKDRLRHITDISNAYAIKMDDRLGRARARVTSAVALGDKEIETLKARLGEITGKDIIVSTDVDEALIGGVIARVGGTIYDGSVRTQLQRMKEAILKEV